MNGEIPTVNAAGAAAEAPTLHGDRIPDAYVADTGPGARPVDEAARS